ncbi:hypothetical protein DFH29DRAFT_961852 [Suillus ampliporus]|nr:hypothetical protein DFH29DRAFT_961852 [Suillus ampliporus]
MSSYYNLRSQCSALTSADTIPGALSESPLMAEPTEVTPTPSLTGKPIPRIGEAVLRPIRSYSDVVGMRSEMAQPGAGPQSASVDSTAVSPRYKANNIVDNNAKPMGDPFVTTSESSSESENDAPWTTASKNARIDLARKTDLIAEAERRLTKEEKRRIHKRRQVEGQAQSQESAPETLGEGPSKGKGLDPQNWGGINFSEAEVDMDAQMEALQGWAQAQSELIEKTIRSKEDHVTRSLEKQIRELKAELARKNVRSDATRKDKGGTSRKKPEEHPIQAMVEKAVHKPSKKVGTHATPPAMDAAAQIAPKSYLGRALEQIRAGKTKQKTRHTRYEVGSDLDGSSYGSSSSSSLMDTEEKSSSSDNSSGDEDSSTTSSYDTPPTRWKHTSKRRKNSKGRKSTRKRTTLKPIPPMEYDGMVDSHAFHRFITKGTAYVEDGNVPRNRQVFVLSHYLKGKAHDFYVRQVSDQPGGWRLSEFFTELFNYCFPLDF